MKQNDLLLTAFPKKFYVDIHTVKYAVIKIMQDY